jgi:hypothetical protein
VGDRLESPWRCLAKAHAGLEVVVKDHKACDTKLWHVYNIAASKVFVNHLVKTRPPVVVCDEFDGLCVAISVQRGVSCDSVREFPCKEPELE